MEKQANINKVSVIVPVFNESENIRELFTEISRVMRRDFTDYEIIFVDDGSNDGSLDILKEMKKKDDRLIYYAKIRSGTHTFREIC